jgi:hypothetical protein
MRCCRLAWVAVEKDFFVAELECSVALVALDEAMRDGSE